MWLLPHNINCPAYGEYKADVLQHMSDCTARHLFCVGRFRRRPIHTVDNMLYNTHTLLQPNISWSFFESMYCRGTCSTFDKDVSPCLSLGMMIEIYMDIICQCNWIQAKQCWSPGAAIFFWVCILLPVTLLLVCIKSLQHQSSYCCVQSHSLPCACRQV